MTTASDGASIPDAPCNPLHSLNHVVVGFDLDVLGVRALEAAVTVARSRGNVRVHAIHVRPPRLIYAEPTLELMIPDEDAPTVRARVDALVARAVGDELDNGVEVITTVCDGACGEVLVDEARRLGASLVVVGTHGRTGLAQFFEGSVAEEVMRHAPCPVLVVHADDCEGHDDRTTDPTDEPTFAKDEQARISSN